MNHIYRVIWSPVTRTWQVAHEHARSRGQSGSSQSSRQRTRSLLRMGAAIWTLNALASAWAAPASQALPSGAQVVHGVASMSTQGNALQVRQTTQRLITNWDSFNIGRDASVQFVQPNAQSVALNRINSQNPTEIFGRLQANGHVILSNAAGVLFGKSAVVDVGAITATSLRLKDEDFLADRLSLQAGAMAGQVENLGQIQAHGGVIALVAPVVKNGGNLVADGGKVAMAAGDEVRLDFTGSGLYTVTVTAQRLDALVENGGAIRARDGVVVLTAGAAGSLLKGVVKQGGEVQATSLVKQGGRIILSGTDLNLTAGSVLDASGAQGGGTIHVGGEWQGGGTTRHATTVQMAAGAEVRADATQQGNGGEVVLWSDLDNANAQTLVQGRISAQGQGTGTQGGRVETSGARLGVSGTVITGQGGQWLLDPANIEVTSSGSTSATAGVNTAGSSTLSVSNTSINTALDTGGNVELYTGSTTANANQIHIQANITKSSGAASTLTLRTGGLIRVDSGVRIGDTAAGNPLSVVLETSGPIYLADNNSATPTVSIHGDLTMGGPSGGNAKGYVVNGSTDRTYQHGVYIGQHVGLSANNITVKGQGFDFTHSSFDGRVYDGGDGVHIAQSAVLDATSHLSVSGVGGVGSRGSQGTNGSTGSNGSNAGTGASYSSTIYGGTTTGERTATGRNGGDAIGGQGGTGGSGTAGGVGGNGGRGVYIASAASLSAEAVSALGTGGVGGVGGAGGTGGMGGVGGNGGTGGNGENADLKNRAANATCSNSGTTYATCQTTYAGTATAGRGGDANGGRGGTGGRGGSGGSGGNGGTGVMVMTAASIQGARGTKVVGVGGRAGLGGTGGAGGQGGDGGRGGQGGRGGYGGYAYAGTAGSTTSATDYQYGRSVKIYSRSYDGYAVSGRDGYRSGGVGGNTGQSGAGGAGGDSGEGVRYESAVIAGSDITNTANITEAGASGNQGALGSRGTSGSNGTRGEYRTYGTASYGGYGGAYNSQRVGIGLRTTGSTIIGSASEVTNISLITDTVRMDTGALVQTAAGGTLLVRPDTSGRFINLGSSATAISSISNSGTNTSTSQAKLNLSQDYFWNGSTGIFKDGFSSITIGSAASNNIVGSNLGFGDQLNLVTGQNITFTGSLTGVGQTLSTQVGSGKTGNFSSATVNVASLAIHSDANDTAKWGTYTFGANTSTANEILNVAGRPQALTLYNAKPLTIGTVDGITGIDASGDVIIRTDNATQANTGITIDAGAYVHTESNTATAIMLDAGLGAFDNNSGLDLDADPNTLTLTTGSSGRWLVFSGAQDPSQFADQRGGIAYEFKQYNLDWTNTTNGATYAFASGSVSAAEGNYRVGTSTSNLSQTAALAESATNGFVYRYAPTIAPEITQTVTKTYSRNNAATVTTAHLAGGADASAVDGDAVKLTATSTSGTYYTTAGASDSYGRVEEEAITLATSSANQTVFDSRVNLPSDAQEIEVWVRANLDANYTRLTAGSDYTVNGTQVTLATGRQTGDIVQIVPLAVDSQTAIAGQTVFTPSGGFHVNSLQVYRGGNLLTAGTDYTTQAGTVTLTSAATASEAFKFVTDLDRDGITRGDVRSDKLVQLANSNMVWQAQNGSANVYGYRITASAEGQVGEITKKALSVSGVTVSNFNDGTYSVTRGKVYDGTTVASISLGNATAQGIISSDSVTMNTPSGGACALNVSVNCYLADYLSPDAGDNIGVTVRGIYLSSTNQASNYTLEGSASATGTIAPKVLDVSGTTLAAKAYDGTTLATISGSTLTAQTATERDAGVTVRSKDGLIVLRDDGTLDAVTLTVSGNYINKNAGTGDANVTYTISGAQASNYTLDPAFRTNANKKQTAMWQLHDGGDAVYKHRITSNVTSVQTSTGNGTSNTSTGYRVSTINEKVATGTVSYSDGVTAGSVPTSVSGIYKAPLKVYANDAEKVPGDIDPTLTRSYAGFVAGESATVLSGLGVSRVAGEIPGTYTITATASSNNYDITFVPGTFTIGAAEKLVIQLNDASRDYGVATDPTAAFAINATGAKYASAQETVTIADGNTLTFNGPTTFDASKGGSVYKKNPVTSAWELVAATDYSVNGNAVTLNTAPANLTSIKVISQYSTKTLTVTRDGTNPSQFILDDGLGTRITVGIQSNDLQTSNVGRYSISVANASRVVSDQVFTGSTNASLNLNTPFVANRGSVWLNDTLLTAGYSVSGDGSTVTLSVAPSASDEIRVISDYDQRISLYPHGGVTPAAPNFSNLGSSNGTLSISPIAATIGIGGSTPDKQYDGTTSLGLSPVLSLSNPVFASDANTGQVDVSGSGAFVSSDAGSAANNFKVDYIVSGLRLSGSKALNYYLSSDTQTSFGYIRPRVLTVTGSQVTSKAYDGSNTAQVTAGTLSGFLGDEVVNLNGVTANFASANVARDANGWVTSQAVTTTYSLTDGVATVGGALMTFKASNYIAQDAAPLSGTITPKSVAINTAATLVSDKTYDGNSNASIVSAGTVMGTVGNETLGLVATGLFDNANAGSNKSVQVGFSLSNGTGLVSNYSLLNPSFQTTASVSPRVLTLSGVSAADKVYDGATDAQVSYSSVNNLVAGESLGVMPIAHFVTPQVSRDGAGNAISQTVTVSYQLNDGLNGKASNYNLSGQNLQAKITPATLSVVDLQVGDKVYDGTTVAQVANAGYLNGLVAGDDVSLSGAPVLDGSGAGVRVVRQGTISLAGGDAGNYNLTWTDGAASVLPAPLTVRALDDAKFVTQSDAAGYQGVVYSGFVNGETANVLSALPSVTRGIVGESEGVYQGALTASGAVASNYSIRYEPGNYTIVPADQLLLRVQSTSSTYGTAPTYSILSAKYLDSDNNSITTLAPPTVSNGVYSYDDGAGGVASFTLGALNPAYSTAELLKVGGYNIGATSVYASSSNFSEKLTVVGGLTVTPKAIAPVASGVSKVYDGARTMSNLSLSLSGLEVRDVVSLTGIGTYGDKNVGSNKGYVLSNLSLLGVDAANYRLSTGSSTTGTDGVVSPKALSLSRISVANKVYDGTALATISTSAAQYQGLVAGDNVVVSAQGSFADKNIGQSKAVLLSSTYSGVDVGNYLITDQLSATASITPKVISLSGAVGVTKTYDGNAWMPVGQVGLGSLQGVINGDSVTTIGAPVFDGATAGSKVIQQGSVLLSGTDAGNYTLNWTNGLGTIARAALTIQANDDAKFVTYDDTAGYAGARFSGFVNGENRSNLTGSLEIRRTNMAQTAGTYSGVIEASGLSSDNYAITYQTGDYTIVPADQLLIRVQDLLGGQAATYGASTTYVVNSAQYLDSNSAAIKNLTVTATGNAIALDDGVGGTAALTLAAMSPVLSGASKLRVGAYDIGATGTSVNGQNFSSTITVIGAHEVVAKGLGLTVSGGTTKTYDGHVGLVTPTIAESGRVSNDSVSYSITGQYANANAATGKNYQVFVGPLTGADSANYFSINGHTLSGTDGVVNAKSVNVSGIAALDKVYDESVAATPYTGAAVFAGMVAGDDLTVSASGVFANKNVGLNKTVTLTSSYGGNDLANYAIVDQASTTASISAKAVTLSTPTVSKVYDGSSNYQATQDDASALTSQLNASSDRVTGATVALNTKNVGENLAADLVSVTIDDGNGGNNYDVTLVGNRSGVINRLPSATWTGAAGDGKWFTPGNWASTSDPTAVGTVPDLTNVAEVILPTNSSVVFNPSDATGATSGGTVFVDAIGGNGSLSQAGGTLAVEGNVNLNGLNQSVGRLVIGGGLTVTDSIQQSVGGLLDITGNVALTQATGDFDPRGLLSLQGQANLLVSAGDLRMLNSGNDFAGAVAVQATNVSIKARNGLELGTSTISGNLEVNTGGAGVAGGITQSGPVSVFGTSTFVAQTKQDQDAVLKLANNWGGAVSFTKAMGGTWRNVSLTDVSGGVTLGDISVGGNLDVTSTGGGINQTDDGTVEVMGTTQVEATEDIVLTNPNNNFKRGIRGKARYLDLGKDNPPKVDSSTIASGVKQVATRSVSAPGDSDSGFISARENLSTDRAANGITVVVIRGAALQTNTTVIKVEVPPNMLSQAKFSFKLPNDVLDRIGTDRTQTTRATLSGGNALPGWLRFEAQDGAFIADQVPEGALPLTVELRTGNDKVLILLSAKELSGSTMKNQEKSN